MPDLSSKETLGHVWFWNSKVIFVHRVFRRILFYLLRNFILNCLRVLPSDLFFVEACDRKACYLWLSGIARWLNESSSPDLIFCSSKVSFTEIDMTCWQEWSSKLIIIFTIFVAVTILVSTTTATRVTAVWIMWVSQVRLDSWLSRWSFLRTSYTVNSWFFNNNRWFARLLFTSYFFSPTALSMSSRRNRLNTLFINTFRLSEW